MTNGEKALLHRACHIYGYSCLWAELKIPAVWINRELLINQPALPSYLADKAMRDAPRGSVSGYLFAVKSDNFVSFSADIAMVWETSTPFERLGAALVATEAISLHQLNEWLAVRD